MNQDGPSLIIEAPPQKRNGPPQNENKNLKKCSSDYFHILHIVELWCDFNMFVGLEAYIYKMFMSSVD